MVLGMKEIGTMKLLNIMYIKTCVSVLSLLAAIALVGPPTIGNASLTVDNGKARFVIHNNTGATIHYMLKWGASGDWQPKSVQPGWNKGHTYPLDLNNRAPAPHIRFHNAAGGYAQYELDFGKFREGRIDESIHYNFKFDGGGKLHLYKQ